MDSEVLYQNIKMLCYRAGKTIAQIEKDLQFSAGSIGKWGQSAPSIEKVMAVAQYFGISIDELCRKSEVDFMNCVIYKTDNHELIWVPCTLDEIMNLRFYEMIHPQDFSEVYITKYKDVKMYLVLNGGKVYFYISKGNNVCLRQNESDEQLLELWNVLEKLRQQQQQGIDEFKEQFASLK